MKTNQKIQGKKNRARGKAFELKVRKDLEKQGWIMFRNSMDVIEGKFKQTTGHWNPFTKSMMMSQSGFPDFICLKYNKMTGSINPVPLGWNIQFVECKGGDNNHNKLDKEEKEKVDWIKYNLQIPVIVANKGEKRGEIIYGI